MSKKDFVTFARMIRAQRHEIKHKMSVAQSDGERLFLTGCAKMVSIIIDEMCAIFASSNDKFDADKFVQACEIDTESK